MLKRFQAGCSIFISQLCLALFWSHQPAAAQAPGAVVEDDLSKVQQAVREARWKDADQFARTYLTNHASSAEAQYLLAFALFREDKPKESLAEYTHAAQIRKPSAADLRCVALDYVLLGDYADADKWMTQSLQWDAHDGEVWYEMGRIKYQENRFAEAIADFQQTLKLLPKLVKAEDNLGLAYEGLNQKDDAISAYQQAIAWQAQSDRKSEQPLLNLGILLRDEGHTTEALPLLLQAASIAPGDGKICAALGKLYLGQGNLSAAEEEFAKAVAIDSKSAPLHFQLGQVYRKEGKTSQASSEFAKAAAIDGSSSSKNQ